jgi:hypothetical protein
MNHEDHQDSPMRQQKVGIRLYPVEFGLTHLSRVFLGNLLPRRRGGLLQSMQTGLEMG